MVVSKRTKPIQHSQRPRRNRQLPTPPTSPPGTPPITPPKQLSLAQLPGAPVKFLSLHRQRCKRLLIRRRARLAESGTTLSILCFPHILEAVVLAVCPETLPVLRLTCREIKHEVDTLLQLHARVRIPLPSDGWSPASPSPSSASSSDSDSELSSESGSQESDDEAEDRYRSPPSSSPAPRAPRPSALFSSLASAAYRSPIPPIPPPMIGRSLSGRIVPRAASVLDIDPLPAKMYYLHFAPAWSARQQERNLWNSPFRPGPWLESWKNISRYWMDCAPQLVRYPRGIGVDDYFLSYQAQKPDRCSVHFGGWDEFELGLRRLNTYYASGFASGEAPEIDAIFAIDLSAERSLPSPRDLDLHHVRRITVHFTHDCSTALQPVRYGFGEMIIALLELFVACAARGSQCTIVGYEAWDKYMLPWWPEHRRLGWNEPDEPWRYTNLSMRRRLRSVIRQLQREVPGARGIREPVRLLTMRQWKRRIGEDWLELLTRPGAVYRGRKALEEYSLLMYGEEPGRTLDSWSGDAGRRGEIVSIRETRT